MIIAHSNFCKQINFIISFEWPHAWLKSCSIYRTCNNTYINNWNKKKFLRGRRWVWVSPFKSPKCAIKNTLLERAALILQFTRNNKRVQKRRKNNYSQRDYTQGSTFKTKSSIPIQKIVVKYLQFLLCSQINVAQNWRHNDLGPNHL